MRELQSFVTMGLALTALLAVACGARREVGAQFITEQQPPDFQIQAAVATASPTRAPAPAPSPEETLAVGTYGAPTPLPTPLPVPPLALEGGTGSLVCLLYPDTRGNPALVAHWTVDVETGATAMVDYPFVAGDNLEISVFGQKLKQAYMESPDGQRIVEIADTLRPWNGEAQVRSSGRHRFYFDNTDGDSVKIMHLVITYHDAAPDSVRLAPHEEKVLIPLPQGGEWGLATGEQGKAPNP